MANNDILQYLRKTPHNTNVNVVKGMIGNGSGSGAIEMETIFDEDITFTYQTGSQYRATNVNWYKDDTISMLEGYLKITLDDIEARGVSIVSYVYINNEYVEFVAFNIILNRYNLFLDDQRYTISIQYGNTQIGQNQYTDRISVYIYGFTSEDDSNLQTYCQTPHHLKIEYFAV